MSLQFKHGQQGVVLNILNYAHESDSRVETAPGGLRPAKRKVQRRQAKEPHLGLGGLLSAAMLAEKG